MGNRGVRVAILLSLLLGTFTAHGQTVPTAPSDLSGVWQKTFSNVNPLIADPPLTAWGRERFDLANRSMAREPPLRQKRMRQSYSASQWAYPQPTIDRGRSKSSKFPTVY